MMKGFARNIEHANNFNAIYQTFFDFAFAENKKLESDLGWPQQNYDKLYSGDIPELFMSDGRYMKIKWIRIPTFTYQSKPMFYTIFLINVDWWEIDNLKSVHNLCMDIMTKKNLHRDNDSYTIFLCGKQRKLVLPYHNLIKRKYNTQTINTNKRHVDEVRGTIFRNISKFFYERRKKFQRIIATKSYETKTGFQKVKLYGQLKKDLNRMKGFAGKMWRFARTFWKIRLLKKRKRKEEYAISNNSSNNKINNKRRLKKAEFFLNKLNRSKVIKPV